MSRMMIIPVHADAKSARSRIVDIAIRPSLIVRISQIAERAESPEESMQIGPDPKPMDAHCFATMELDAHMADMLVAMPMRELVDLINSEAES